MVVDDLVGASFMPTDGQASPSDIAQSLARGARMHGARLFEDVSCAGFEIADGRVIGVRTPAGTIRCDKVVLCAGLWSRQIAALAGVSVPAPGGEASIRHHRAGRRHRRRHGHRPRSRPAHLFQGGGRRPRLRRLRAGPGALAHRRCGRGLSGQFRLPPLRRRLGSFRAAHDGGARARAGAGDRRHQADDQRAGILHA